ncbi:MAG: acyltransferase [Planctomycetes bacterium]|nr:acyltransferase [Planctomycetota bacterium]
MLQSLQACRAVAAILVVLLHTSNGIYALPKYFSSKPFGDFFDFGTAGVDFFFVLSGFIMMHIHADDIGNPRAFGPYLWKRFTRIYPPYWAVLVAVIPVFFVAPHFGFGFEREPDVIIRAILLFPHPEWHMVLGVAWTLVFEVFFYLLFGLLILNRRLGTLVLVVWTVGVLAHAQFATHPWIFVFSHQFIRFLAGVGVAMFLRRWQLPYPRIVALVGATLFLTTGMFDAYARPIPLSAQIAGYTLGSALTLAGLVQAERLGLIRPPQLLVYLGNASYAIYLVHFLALSLLAKIAKAAYFDRYVPAPILFFMLAAGAVGIGCLFHHAIENRLHQWTKQYFRTKERPRPIDVAPVRAERKAA